MRTQLDEASDPETPFHRLVILSDVDRAAVRRALVDNPSIAVNEDGAVTNKILLSLAIEFPDEVGICPAFALFGIEMKDSAMLAVAEIVAQKAKCPSLLALIFHEFGPGNVGIRFRISKNSKSPGDILRFLADEKNEPEMHIRENVAENLNTPPDVLRFMADINNEPNWTVRAGVSQNPSTPEDVLRFMANKSNEPNSSVRLGVTVNPSTPEDVLRLMADKTKEPNSLISRSATQALKDRGLL